MSLTIKSTDSTDEWKIDPVSKAGRVTLYNASGLPVNSTTPINIGITNVIDDNNTTIVPLSAGGVYTGTGTDISNYGQVTVELYGRPGLVAGDITSAKGSLFLEFSKDNANWRVSIPYLIRDPSLVIPVPLAFVHKYFRVRYLNDGGVAAIAALQLQDTAGVPMIQTVFELTTYKQPLATKELSRTMDQGIQGSDSAVLVRAGVMGRNPSLDYTNKNASGISRENNSTAVLGPAASFTGNFEEVIGFQSVLVTINTDLVGTLELHLSTDGITFIPVTRTFTNVNIGQVYAFLPSTRYVRIRYTNTAGTQGFFRLQTIFKSEAVGSVFQAANTPLSPFSLTQTVVSVPSDGVKTTYSASVLGFGPVLVPTDIFTIIGSATRIIRILSISISATKTVAAQIDIQFIKRITASTGGVPTVLISALHDSLNIASTALVQVYTVNPVLGTSGGVVRVDKLFLPATGTAVDGGTKTYTFGNRPGQGIVLRGVAESFNLNLNAVTATGGSFNIWCEYSEE